MSAFGSPHMGHSGGHSPDDPLFNRRWHDKDPEVSRAVRGIEQLPTEYQQVFAQIIIKLVDHLQEQRKLRDGLVELGAERIVALMKSQSKRRWYDQDKMLHKAFNNFSLLEEADRPALARPVNDGIDVVVDYLDYCDRREVTPSLQSVVNLVMATIQHGQAGGHEEMRRRGFWDEQCGKTREEILARRTAAAPKPEGPAAPVVPINIGERDRGLHVERD